MCEIREILIEIRQNLTAISEIMIEIREDQSTICKIQYMIPRIQD